MQYMVNEARHRDYYRNKNNEFLSPRTFKKFCSNVVKHPKVNIVLPLVLAVILSSKLFSIAISPTHIWKGLNENQYMSKVEILMKIIVVVLRNCVKIRSSCYYKFG